MDWMAVTAKQLVRELQTPLGPSKQDQGGLQEGWDQ